MKFVLLGLFLLGAVYSASSLTLVKRATKQEIITRADALVVKLNAEIQELTELGRVLQATEYDEEVKAIKKLSDDLKAAKDETPAVKQMEETLLATVTRLEEQLKKTEAATKEMLIKRADELVRRAQAEVRELKQTGKTEQAAKIEEQEKAIAKISEQIEAATEETPEIEALEEKLRMAEKDLFDALEKIEKETKDALIKRADDLLIKAREEVKELKAAGRLLEAEKIEIEEKAITKLAEEILKATEESAETEIFEARLDEAEKRLAEELRKLELENP